MSDPFPRDQSTHHACLLHCLPSLFLLPYQQHPAVAEAAVIGIEDELKGEVPHAFIILQDGVTLDAKQVEKELVAAVRNDIGAVAAFRKATVVKKLPKTRSGEKRRSLGNCVFPPLTCYTCLRICLSGKILRKTMRKLLSNLDVPTPATIDDPTALDELKEIYKRERIGPIYAGGKT